MQAEGQLKTHIRTLNARPQKQSAREHRRLPLPAGEPQRLIEVEQTPDIEQLQEGRVTLLVEQEVVPQLRQKRIRLLLRRDAPQEPQDPLPRLLVQNWQHFE